MKLLSIKYYKDIPKHLLKYFKYGSDTHDRFVTKTLQMRAMYEQMALDAEDEETQLLLYSFVVGADENLVYGQTHFESTGCPQDQCNIIDEQTNLLCGKIDYLSYYEDQIAYFKGEMDTCRRMAELADKHDLSYEERESTKRLIARDVRHNQERINSYRDKIKYLAQSNKENS